MKEFLILKLQGAMQAWGGHTYETFRPSYIFPTRSGILGLLGACLGIERDNIQKREDLNQSFELTIKAEKRRLEKQVYKGTQVRDLSINKMTDYHTVLDGRRANGKPRKEAIISYREYLNDAEFTLILDFKKDAIYNLNQIKEAIEKPIFTPFLGRRSCPLHRPLFEKVFKAENIKEVLKELSDTQGVVYSESQDIGGVPIQVRDVPIKDSVRRFANRVVYIQGESNVS